MTISIHYPFSEPVGVYPGIVFGDVGNPMILTGTSLAFWDTKEAPPLEASLLLLEPPIVDPASYRPEVWERFRRVYTFRAPDGIPNELRYRATVPPLWEPLGPLCQTPWADRKNAVVAVMGNKYESRQRRLDDLYHRCKSHGIGLEVYGRPPFRRDYYHGIVNDKRRLLEQYRWCYCPENSYLQNYLTEKLPEAVLAGCIPIIDNVGCYEESYPGVFPWEFVQGTTSFHHVTSADHYEFLRQVKVSKIHYEMSTDRMWEFITKHEGVS